MDLGWAGIWLLIAGGAAIVVEGALAAWWSVRITRRAQALNERLRGEQAHLQTDVERLRVSVAESAVLWQPYRRWLRWLRHPLAIAVLQSYARRKVMR